MGFLARLPWWSAFPISGGLGLMGVFAPDAVEPWLRATLFWAGALLFGLGSVAAAWHFRPDSWLKRHVAWRFRLRQPAHSPPFDLAQLRIAPAAPEVTATSYKGKPLVRLQEPERGRVLQAMLAITDYLESDFAAFLRPFQELRDYQRILRERGGAGFHAMVEAPRPGMRAFIDDFANHTTKPYQREMLVAQLEITSIKSKATGLWDAVKQISDVSQLLPPAGANGEALKPLIRGLSEVLDSVQTEVDRVLNEITVLRLRVSRGELE